MANAIEVKITGKNEIDPALRAAENSIGNWAKNIQSLSNAAGTGLKQQTSALQMMASALKSAEDQAKSASSALGKGYTEQATRAREAIGKFYSSLADGGDASRRSVSAAITQVALLRREIERTQGSVEAAAPEIAAEFRDVEHAAEQMKKEYSELNKVVQRQMEQLALASGQWRGFGAMLRSQVSPEVTALATKLTAVVTVAGLAWAAGKKAATATGINPEGYALIADGWESAKRSGRAYHDTLGNILLRTQQIMNLRPSGNIDATGFLAPIRRGIEQGPARPTDAQIYQSRIITENRMREENRAADQKRLADYEQWIALEQRHLQNTKELVGLTSANALAETAEIEHKSRMLTLRGELTRAEVEGNETAISQVKKLIAEEQRLYALRRKALLEDLPHRQTLAPGSPLWYEMGATTDRWRPYVRDYDPENDPLTDDLRRDYLAAVQRGDQQNRRDAEQLSRQLEARLRDQKFVDTLSDVFADAAMTGGKNFGEIAARTFNEVVTAGADSIMAAIFGKRGDPALGQDPNLYYGANGKPLTGWQAQAAGVARAGLTYGTVAYSGYQGGRSGADNAQTSGLVSGATAGATFGVYGAIIGAMIGWGSAYIGRLRAKDDEKWAVPSIDANGNVTVDRPSTTRRLGSERYPGTISWLIGRARTGGSGEREVPNTVTDAEVEDMVKSITETYNTFKDAYVKILLSIPNAVITQIGRIDGQFQNAPSKDFLENFERWVSGTLPDQIAEQFREGMEGAYVSMGLSVEKFNELWKEFDALDPAKAVTLWATLADALRDFQTASDFFTQTDPMGMFGGSATFQREMIRLQADSRTSVGQRISTFDDEILRFAAGIENLSLEGQINAMGELGRMQMQRYQMEKEAIQEIFDILMGAKAQLTDDLDDLAVMGMVNADGSPDHYGIAGYWQGRADDALGNLGSATTAAQAREEAENFRRYILAAGNAGLAQAQTPEERQKWIDWMREQLGAGYAVLETTLGRLGKEINDVNDAFAEEVQPVIDNLTTAIGEVDEGLGDLGEEIGRTIEPIDEFRRAIINATDALNGNPSGEKMGVVLPFTGPRLETASADLATFGQHLNSTGSGLRDVAEGLAEVRGQLVSFAQTLASAGETSSDFAARTVASRKY